MINVTIKKSFLVLILKKVFESIEMFANLVSMRVRKSKEKEYLKKKTKKVMIEVRQFKLLNYKCLQNLLKELTYFVAQISSQKNGYSFCSP